MKKEMLINAAQTEECRIAILEDGVLEELYVERANQETYVGNIYKGKIVNIEPSIQAAFVDFGGGRNGFLHVSDVDPAYYRHLLPKDVLAQFDAEQDEESGGNRGSRGSNDRGNRGGDRGDRGRGRDTERAPRPERTEPRPAPTAPPVMTTWLEPPTPTRSPSAEGDDDFGFGMGLLNDDAPPPLPKQAVPTPVEDSPDWELVEELPPPLPTEARLPQTQSGSALPGPTTNHSTEKVERSAARQAAPAADDEFDSFGAGLFGEETIVELEAVTDATEEPVADAEEKTKKRTVRRAKPKVEETAEGEEPGKKPRVRRKKKDDEGNDEPPAIPMPSAEHRTAGEDEAEPEIRPFFTDSADFDPDAPNDRFANSPRSSSSDEPAGFGGNDDAPAPRIERFDDTPASEVSDPDMVIGRGFNDTEHGEYVGAGERKDNRRGGSRDRGDRGDRGGRDRDRERPRGDRGDRDRGPPRGRSGPSRGPGGPRREREFPRMPIEKIFKRGQEVIVQVIKEGIGTKVPTLSTKVSIAGRYLVLMPCLARVGVSRKIEDMDARRRLREIMVKMPTPKGVGFIVRTAAVDRDAEELQNDLVYLLRLWQVVSKRIRKAPAPVEVYRESDMITRTIRDMFTKDVDTIWVDDPTAYQHASEFLQIVMPKFANRIKHHDEVVPLFHKFKVEEEIVKINHKRIDLPRGGSIIIEQTEALVAIDVNSGTFRADNNAEETAFQMNMIAAREIARQLRLRDLGGVIVNDFIDMRSETHRRKVEDCLRDSLLRDKARSKILRISQFGIIEMTRQRLRPSLKKRIFNECGHCKGTGYVKNSETVGIEVMRLLHLAAHRSAATGVGISSVAVTVHAEAGFHLLNRKRREIAEVEQQGRLEVTIHSVLHVSPDHMELKCHDANGNEVRLIPAPPPPRMGGGRPPRGERRYPAPLD